VSRPRALRDGRSRQAGFTLTELLMAIVLSAVFAVGLYSFFFTGLTTARSHESQAIAQSTGRTALDRVTDDLRQSVAPDSTSAPLISLSPTAVEMYVDPSRAANASAPKPRKVRYAIVGNQLIREYAAPIGATPPYSYGAYGADEVLVSGMNQGTTPVFTAYSAQRAAFPGTPTAAQLLATAQVNVHLLIGQKTGNNPTTLELNADVVLRNAGAN
jgi:prepilin-type N-terminal cleavage/methylation domain-containing protein